MACFSNAILEPLIAVATMVVLLSLNRMCVGARTVSKSAAITQKRSALPLRSTAVTAKQLPMSPLGKHQKRRCSGLVITAVENRFGRVNILPKPIEWLTDNGSCFVASNTKSLLLDIGITQRTCSGIGIGISEQCRIYLVRFRHDAVSNFCFLAAGRYQRLLTYKNTNFQLN